MYVNLLFDVLHGVEGSATVFVNGQRFLGSPDELKIYVQYNHYKEKHSNIHVIKTKHPSFSFFRILVSKISQTSILFFSCIDNTKIISNNIKIISSSHTC